MHAQHLVLSLLQPVDLQKLFCMGSQSSLSPTASQQHKYYHPCVQHTSFCNPMHRLKNVAIIIGFINPNKDYNKTAAEKDRSLLYCQSSYRRKRRWGCGGHQSVIDPDRGLLFRATSSTTGPARRPPPQGNTMRAF